VSQDEIKPTPQSVDEQPGQQPQPTPVEPGATPSQAENEVQAATDPNAPTIGTGTSIALGCVAGTVVLIVIGLLYLLIAALF
jgi:hypothetical protein